MKAGGDHQVQLAADVAHQFGGREVFSQHGGARRMLQLAGDAALHDPVVVAGRADDLGQEDDVGVVTFDQFVDGGDQDPLVGLLGLPGVGRAREQPLARGDADPHRRARAPVENSFLKGLGQRECHVGSQVHLAQVDPQVANHWDRFLLAQDDGGRASQNPAHQPAAEALPKRADRLAQADHRQPGDQRARHLEQVHVHRAFRTVRPEAAAYTHGKIRLRQGHRHFTRPARQPRLVRVHPQP